VLTDYVLVGIEHVAGLAKVVAGGDQHLGAKPTLTAWTNCKAALTRIIG
jgi:hypothetical protein